MGSVFLVFHVVDGGSLLIREASGHMMLVGDELIAQWCVGELLLCRERDETRRDW